MDSSRSIKTFLAALAVSSLLAMGCNPGTEEPDAPAAPSEATSAAGGSASPGAAASAPSSEARGPGAIDPARIPTELPEGVEAAVPDNFPSDLPIYPGSQAAQGRGADLGGVAMSAVQLMTGDSPSQAYDFYRSQLESDGWTLEEMGDLGQGSAINATKGSRKVSLLISPSADGGADIFVVTEG